MTDKYKEIIHLPHHVSSVHPQMSMYSRAAQFASFSALSGHGEAIRETERWTAERIDLEDGEKEMLNRKLAYLLDHLDKRPEVSISYFQPDLHKAGGAYKTLSGIIRKMNECCGTLIFEEGQVIGIQSIVEIECSLFDEMDYF